MSTATDPKTVADPSLLHPVDDSLDEAERMIDEGVFRVRACNPPSIDDHMTKKSVLSALKVILAYVDPSCTIIKKL